MKIAMGFSGTVVFSAIGAYNENFISSLIENGVKVRNVKVENNIMYVQIRRTDYLKASKTARIFRTRIRIVEKKGVYFKIKKTDKHIGILCGIFIGIFTVLMLNNYIWRIEIHGNNTLSENLILKTVQDNGISLGQRLSGVNANEASIRLKAIIDEISWANIEIDGSRIDIYVNEVQNVEKSEIPLKNPCNVIASKSGVIVETEVYSGSLLYSKGSGISEGNVIVSGIVNDGADNIILTHANAKIIAEFTEKVELRQDYTTIEQVKSRDEKEEKELMLFGFVFPLTERVEIEENMVCSEEIKSYSVFGAKLPWKIKTNTYSLYEDYSVTRTSEDLLKLLEQKFELYCDNFFLQYEILDVKKSYKSDENGITLVADVKLKGNIAVQKEISEHF